MRATLRAAGRSPNPPFRRNSLYPRQVVPCLGHPFVVKLGSPGPPALGHVIGKEPWSVSNNYAKKFSLGLDCVREVAPPNRPLDGQAHGLVKVFHS
jgi:hypothetical protein